MKKGGKTSQLVKIESLLRHGKISRREFIDRLSALRLTSAISPELMNRKEKAEAPNKGGRLKIGMSVGRRQIHWIQKPQPIP